VRQARDTVKVVSAKGGREKFRKLGPKNRIEVAKPKSAGKVYRPEAKKKGGEKNPVNGKRKGCNACVARPQTPLGEKGKSKCPQEPGRYKLRKSVLPGEENVWERFFAVPKCP